MKNNFRSVLIIALVLVTLFGCSKNDTITISRISKIVTQTPGRANDTIAFGYTASNQLSRYEVHDSLGLQSYFDISYNGTQAQQIDYSERFGTQFEKTWSADLFITGNGKITGVIINHFTGIGAMDTLKFIYNQIGNLAQVMDVSSDLNADIKIYTFTGSGGNLTKIVEVDSSATFHSSVIAATNTYTYDTKKSPWYGLVLPLFLQSILYNSSLYFSANNVITETDAVLSVITTITNSYQYDANNNPVSATSDISSPQGSTVKTSQFFYETVSL